MTIVVCMTKMMFHPGLSKGPALSGQVRSYIHYIRSGQVRSLWKKCHTGQVRSGLQFVQVNFRSFQVIFRSFRVISGHCMTNNSIAANA